MTDQPEQALAAQLGRPLYDLINKHLADGQRAEQQLAKVRDLRDDLRGITGARWIADALDKILDGDQPPAPAHDAGPSVRQAAADDRTYWERKDAGEGA